MDTTTTQQFIAGAPIHSPGPAKCGTIERLEVNFELPEVHGEIVIKQTSFDSYSVSVDTSTEDRSYYAIALDVTGEDVVDTLIGLVGRTVPDTARALRMSYCNGQSSQWATIRDVAIERIEHEYKDRMDMKHGGREDVSF